jgi:acetyl coenzyme A synthetase (ADP forming)-like protein
MTLATHDALLADGTVVSVRAIEPDDAERLVHFHEQLSPESIRMRFFTPHPRLSDAELARFTTVDHHNREALVALLDDEIVGVARYDRLPDSTDAEVAFVVTDRWQGTGVGTLLLDHLAARARAEGIERFVAETLGENRRMAQVFQRSGLTPATRWADGVLHLEMPLVPTPDLVALLEEREHVAESHSIGRLLTPRSIAVVGASSREDSVGHVILRQLQQGNFAGELHPVNQSGDPVGGLPSTKTVAEIDGEVDLAIVAVPAVAVAGVVRDCAARQVHGLVVISGGFAELGREGATQQREIVAEARRHGMRIIGPNCVGVVNTDPDVNLHATFGAVQPVPGTAALASQSGAVGIAVLNAATACGLGVSSFVSLGNKADVSSNDLLQFWEDDPRTNVVLLYLESFGNPAKFARLARRIGMHKPIVAVKSGRTAAGRRAAGSHTAAMASDDTAVDALLSHCGVVRVDTIDDLIDTGLVLASQPLPEGSRIAIVGNSGGPGIMAADACAGAGLALAELRDATRTALDHLLPANASTSNPVDVLGDAGPATYAAAIGAVVADDNVDMVVVVHAPTLVTDADEVAAAVAATESSKPIVAVFIGRDRGLLTHDTARTPVFGSVERAVAALAAMAEHANWRRRPHAPPTAPTDVDRTAGRAVIDAVLADTPGGRWLTAAEVDQLLDSYGIPRVAALTVTSRAAARAAAQQLGLPVALKASGPTIVHKTDVGGVALQLDTAAAVERAWRAMHDRLGDEMTGAVVQQMAGSGVEMIAGVVRDPTFGPLVVLGMGGTLAELLGDRAVRVAPLSLDDADEMVRSLRCAPLLSGYRGSPPVDTVALEETVVRLGALATDLPQVAELDLNPVIASPTGAVAVDARVRVLPVPIDATEPMTARRMSPPRG